MLSKIKDVLLYFDYQGRKFNWELHRISWLLSIFLYPELVIIFFTNLGFTDSIILIGSAGPLLLVGLFRLFFMLIFYIII
jgi:hypothetical protein